MITRTDVEQEIRQTLDLDQATLDAALRLEDLPTWDSVNALRLLVDLETSLGVRVDINKFMTATTVEDLIGACLGGVWAWT